MVENIPTLDECLTVRITSEAKEKLLETAASYGYSYSDLVREVVDAINNRTLRIIVPKSQLKTIRGVHVNAGKIT